MNITKAASRLIAGVFGLALSCVAMASVGVEYDKRTNFRHYKTYAWAKGAPAPDPQMQATLRDAVERELAAQGLRKTGNLPDVYVTTYIATWRQRVINVNELGYSGFYWRRWEGLYPPTTQVYYLPVGTVTIELLDGASRERIWRGFAIDYLRGRAERTYERVDTVTRKMFKRFPRESGK
ncbi:MAG: DUF4136 domain-containing protein [Acidiferrobacterales bacterium]|nr:DUF4136 domain-containing protein [Acidiferrobacterales bacterium]